MVRREDGSCNEERNVGDLAHHVFAALHEALVDDLAGVVLACIDVDRLLHDGIRAAAERLARPILLSRIQ